MGLSVEKNGFISFQSLVKSIGEDLHDSGFFTVANADGTNLQSDPAATGHPSFAGLSEKVTLFADTGVDSLAQSQPWAFTMIFNEEEQWLDFYLTAQSQVIDVGGDFRIAVKKKNETKDYLSGKLTPGSQHNDTDSVFRSASFEQWGMPESDTQANPMSYRLVLTDHGFSLFIWVESYDSDGDKHSWFVCQRMVTSTGNPVVSGKAPLFCVFSNNGFPDDSNLNAPDPNAVMKFVVREADVNSPTFAVSAIEDTADSTRIINGAQQVSIREDNNIVMTFPNGLNTQRYGYPHQLDLLAIISADVVSQSTDIQVNPFSEGVPRVYRGMNADHVHNKGARILLWIDGGTLA
jgi:hypothetical protein